ncbi:hypothetical protein ACFY0A_45455 [Streptomyces sp. NPDC001698]|uniref:hypothetical protein n=1 Tax=Streptomyces sp. NPDC001698 TaxID=3364601 RepID=UPI003697DE69
MLVDVGAVPAGERVPLRRPLRRGRNDIGGAQHTAKIDAGRELDHMRSASPSVRCGRLYIRKYTG